MKIPGKNMQNSSGKQKKKLSVLHSDKGAITIEYVMTMVVACLLMVGVELLFNRMAAQIITRIKSIAMSFPNI